jgi:hypothetical protein
MQGMIAGKGSAASAVPPHGPTLVLSANRDPKRIITAAMICLTLLEMNWAKRFSNLVPPDVSTNYWFARVNVATPNCASQVKPRAAISVAWSRSDVQSALPNRGKLAGEQVSWHSRLVNRQLVHLGTGLDLEDLDFGSR